MNRDRTLESASKFLSLILRHHPEIIGITLDDHGWADGKELLKGVNQTRTLTAEQL